MAGVSGLCLMLLAVGLAVAQRPGADVRDWALEMPNWPDLNGLFYSDIPERGEGLSIFHTPRWQPGWDRSDSTRPQATALKLTYRLENDRVRLEAFVMLGPFDHNDTPRSLEGVPQESAGMLLLRLGEPVTLTGLAKYGLEPLPVRLVIHKPPVRLFCRSSTTRLPSESKALIRTAPSTSFRFGICRRRISPACC